MEEKNIIPDWAEGLNCAVTVCDADCRILYMNEKSRETFARHGDIIGHNLRDYHPQRAIEIIERLLAGGGTNSYTISKNGQRKMIYQSAYRINGKVAGLVEISMVIPEDMPHYVR
ncbi:MAG: PAS domain-containing protein [Candidatus Amulumruptor caecigallinarius]|nr:PAS domain-containing protein [Candidatus Amulumruptor caecigallinarius]